MPVGGEDVCDCRGFSLLCRCGACALNLKVDAVVLDVIVVVALNKAHYASTDSSQTNNANVDAAHSRLLIFGVRVSPIVAHVRLLAVRIRQVQKRAAECNAAASTKTAVASITRSMNVAIMCAPLGHSDAREVIFVGNFERCGDHSVGEHVGKGERNRRLQNCDEEHGAYRRTKRARALLARRAGKRRR